MTYTAQTAHSFAAELKCLGITFPAGTTKLTFQIKGDKPAILFASIEDLLDLIIRKVKIPLIDKATGEPLSSQQAYKLMVGKHFLPEGTTEYEVVAEEGSVVMSTVKYATPIGSFDFLKNFVQ